MAQQTKMGHVYVISNIGAFGDDVYKIGMTRRLEPMDRVRELGDASVPFPFDVHAIIFSEDAPSLEHKLHQIFDQDRLNMVNSRREFFRVPLTKIKEEAEKVGARVQFTMLAEAQEYRESERIRNEKSTNQGDNIHEGTIALEVPNYPEEI
jgi:chromosome segregation ATPase